MKKKRLFFASSVYPEAKQQFVESTTDFEKWIEYLASRYAWFSGHMLYA